jgi:choline kinase
MPASSNGTQRITTALLLAAGTGSRLWPLTHDSPKCLTEVNGMTLLERLVCSLRKAEFKRLIVVVGYLDRRIREALTGFAKDLTIEFVSSPKYRTTNNIYSLWIARNAIREPFLLVESDLIFDEVLLEGMRSPDKIAISRILPWMNGTTVALDECRRVTRFHVGSHPLPDELMYKTVNMYSFSIHSWQRVADRLERYIAGDRVDAYYETVFAEMVAERSLAFQAVFFDNERWYEIDTLEDLREADRLFPTNRKRHASGV